MTVLKSLLDQLGEIEQFAKTSEFPEAESLIQKARAAIKRDISAQPCLASRAKDAANRNYLQ